MRCNSYKALQTETDTKGIGDEEAGGQTNQSKFI